jgi:hypothetical protein
MTNSLISVAMPLATIRYKQRQNKTLPCRCVIYFKKIPGDSWEAGLFLEHLAQRGEGEAQGSARHSAEPPREPLLVEGSQLIEQYKSVSASAVNRCRAEDRNEICKRQGEGGALRVVNLAVRVVGTRIAPIAPRMVLLMGGDGWAASGHGISFQVAGCNPPERGRKPRKETR